MIANAGASPGASAIFQFFVCLVSRAMCRISICVPCVVFQFFVCLVSRVMCRIFFVCHSCRCLTVLFVCADTLLTVLFVC